VNVVTLAVERPRLLAKREAKRVYEARQQMLADQYRKGGYSVKPKK